MRAKFFEEAVTEIGLKISITIEKTIIHTRTRYEVNARKCCRNERTDPEPEVAGSYVFCTLKSKQTTLNPNRGHAGMLRRAVVSFIHWNRVTQTLFLYDNSHARLR